MTETQQRLLIEIRSTHHTHRSLAAAMGWRSTASTRRAVAALVKRGLVVVRPGMARGFVVIVDGVGC